MEKNASAACQVCGGSVYRCLAPRQPGAFRYGAQPRRSDAHIFLMDGPLVRLTLYNIRCDRRFPETVTRRSDCGDA